MVHSVIRNAARAWAGGGDCPLRAQLDWMRRRGGLRPVLKTRLENVSATSAATKA